MDEHRSGSANAFIRTLLDGAQNHQAFECARALLAEQGGLTEATAGIGYLAALAAARGGAREVASVIVDNLRELTITESSLAADIESLAGRIAKDVFVDATDDDTRRAAADAAFNAYQRADELHPNVHARINAATMAAMLGDDAQSHRLAMSAVASIDAEPNADHWHDAARGEAMLLLGHFAAAIDCYTRAAHRARDRFGDVASMRRQLRMLSHIYPEAVTLQATVAGPRVVAFSGHMVDQPGRTSPRFPAVIEPLVKVELERWIDSMLPAIGYSQAACGSDLLFCEALLARGQEVNIVLPFARDDYIAQSVAVGGEGWQTRFENVMQKASSVVYATDERYLGDDSLFEHTSNLIQGMAFLRSRTLTVEPMMLVVADASQSGATGGTLATLTNWTARGQAHEIISLEPLRAKVDLLRFSHRETGAQQATKPSPIAGGRHIKALLFADVKGFSRLPEEHFPAFFTTFLGMVPRVLDACDIQPLEMSSRGDGLYMVFDDCEQAARFSWELSRGIGEVDWSTMGLPADTHVRIALHAGPVFTAVDPVTRNLAHYGAHVTRAARVEPIVVPGQILVTEPFAAVLASQAQSAFACDLVGVEPLAKGYGEARLYRLRLG